MDEGGQKLTETCYKNVEAFHPAVERKWFNTTAYRKKNGSSKYLEHPSIFEVR